jgi:hypothetical protein
LDREFCWCGVHQLLGCGMNKMTEGWLSQMSQ